MSWSDFAIVFATLVGPIAAVQAQKWLERRREIENRKVRIFATLMATRSDRLTPDHIKALNTIELAFYGRQGKNGQPRRTKEDNEVIGSWREYFRHLDVDVRKFDDAGKQQWAAQANELFLNMLEKLAVATRYRFDRDQLRSAHYHPEASVLEGAENLAMRHLLIAVLSGKQPLVVRPAANEGHAPPP